MELTTVKYPMGCIIGGQRLVLDAHEAVTGQKNKSGQREGIRVVTGLTRFVQKALGYAEEIEIIQGKKKRKITINKRSRNKWIARVSGNHNELTKKQHAVINKVIYQRTHYSSHKQRDILANHLKGFASGREDIKAFQCDYTKVQAVDHLFQMQMGDEEKEKEHQRYLALDITNKITNYVKNSSLVLMQDYEDFTSKLSIFHTSIFKADDLQKTIDSTVYFDQETYLKAFEISCGFCICELKFMDPSKALMQAVRSNTLTENRLKFLLAKGADLHAIKINNLPLVHYAVHQKNVPMLKMFLNHGGDVHAKNAYGVPLIVCAIQSGSCEMIELLLANQCDVNAMYQRKTLLHRAVTLGNQKVVRLLVQHHADVGLKDRYGYTAIHLAMIHHQNDLQKRRALLSALIKEQDKSILNIPNLRGTPPLHCAIENYDVEVVKILIENGADLSATDKNQITPLFKALYSPRDLDGRRDRREEIVKLLLEAAPDSVNQPDNQGVTPLCVAVYNFDLLMLQELLNNGADVNSQDEKGNTPLHVAIRTGGFCKIMIEELLKKGADVDIPNKAGLTPFHFAFLFRCDNALLKKFLDKSQNINLPDTSGSTLLHLAVSQYNLKMTQLLIRAGANVGAQNKDQKTPVQIACKLPSYHPDRKKIIEAFTALAEA